MVNTPACDTYQIKVTLRGARPPIWRRLQVPAAIRLSSLHDVLQITMGWEDDHLHQFTHERRLFGVPDGEGLLPTLDEAGVSLDTLLRAPKEKLVYEYDFGDSWEHVVSLEAVVPHDPEVRLPRCTGGRRACPPEDVGGIWGYEEMLAALEAPDDPDNQERLEWLGDGFDPTYFDADAVNADLRSVRLAAEEVTVVALGEGDGKPSILDAVVEAAWRQIAALDVAGAERVIKRCSRKQEELMGFILATLEELDPEAREVGLFMAMVVMEAFRAGPARKVKRVTVSQIQRTLAANTEGLVPGDDVGEEELDAAFPALQTDEPALMHYVAETLMEEDPDGPELDEREVGSLIMILKTVIDCLHRASRF